jgi:hypothetical protein
VASKISALPSSESAPKAQFRGAAPLSLYEHF